MMMMWRTSPHRSVAGPLVAVAFLLAATGPARGQSVALSLAGFIPNVARTNQAAISVRYALTATPSTLVDVFFFLSDGSQTTVAGLNPAGSPFTATIPLPTAPTDGVAFTLTGIARRQDTGAIAIGSPTLSIIVDNVGPVSIALTSPNFPTTAFVSPLVIRGLVRNSTGPEPGGTVIVRRQDSAAPGQTVGAGAILAGGSFIASVDLAGFPVQTPVPISIQAIDQTGNAGASVTVTVVNADPKRKVTAENLRLTPPSGTLTRNRAVMIEGDVTGDVGPFTVTFLVDNAVESQVAGLAAGQPFRHTLALFADGSHSLTLSARDALGNASLTTLGSLTLDTTPPSPPLILSPARVVTNQNAFTIKGQLPPDAMAPGGSPVPSVLVRGPSGARFIPAQPQPVTDPSGLFETTVDISALPDGTFDFDVVAIDAAGNASAGTPLELRPGKGAGDAGEARGGVGARDIDPVAGLPQVVRRRALAAILDRPRP